MATICDTSRSVIVEGHLVTDKQFAASVKGKKNNEQVEKLIWRNIRELESGSYRKGRLDTSSRDDIEHLNVLARDSEVLIMAARDARNSNASLGSLRRKFRIPGSKSKTDKRIEDLSLSLTKALQAQYTNLLETQLKLSDDQERRLSHQERVISELEIASFGHQSFRKSTMLVNANNRNLDLSRPRSRASIKDDIISWLKAPKGSEERYRGYRMIRLNEPDTCTWLGDTSEYRLWSGSDTPSCLWIHGTPGTGKSVLVSKVLDTFSSLGHCYAYYFLGHCKMQTAWDVAAVLLQQLCRKSTIMPETLRNLKDSNGADRQPQLEQLLQALGEVKPSKPGDVTIVLDAWDISNMHHVADFSKLLSCLRSLPWKILITSRTRCPTDFIQNNLVHLDICSWAFHDLEMVVLDRLRKEISISDQSFMNQDDKFLEEIANGIARKSNKTFFLAEVQTQRILEQVNLRDIRATLDQLPCNPREIIYQAFDLVMDQQENLRSLASRSLVWLANTKMPLTVEGLREGFATIPSATSFIRNLNSSGPAETSSSVLIHRKDSSGEIMIQQEVVALKITSQNSVSDGNSVFHIRPPGSLNPEAFERTLVTHGILFSIDNEAKPFLGAMGCCKGLLIQEPGSLHVLLAFDGIKEHLETYRQQVFTQIHYDTELQNLALTCLYYLLLSKFGSGPCHTQERYLERIEDSPFLEYAATCWLGHVRNATNPDVTYLVSMLFKSRNNLASAVQVYLLNGLPSRSEEEFKSAYESSKSMTPLQMATKLKLPEIVRFLVLGSDPLEADCYGNTPLHEAMRNFDFETFKILFEKAVELPFFRLDGKLASGHFLANVRDRELVFDFYKQNVLKEQGLLEAIRAENFHGVLAWLSSGGVVDISSMEAAISSQSTNIKLLMIRFGTEVHDLGPMILGHKTLKGQTEILKILLDHYSAMPKDELLIEATRTGNLEVAKILLEHKANIDVQDPKTGKGVLHLAAGQGKSGLVKFYLAHGADSCQVDKQGRTPLFDAIVARDVTSVKILLQYGVDIDAAETTNNRKALHEASIIGNLEMVVLIRNRSTSVDYVDKKLKTPADYAKDSNIARLLRPRNGETRRYPSSLQELVRPDKDFPYVSLARTPPTW